jgi:hypothetical protein
MSEPAVPTFAADALVLFDEAFERHSGMFLDKGTTLFETLGALDAAAASRAVGPDSGSIAAHVEHIRFYLDVAESYWLGQPPEAVDWKAIWRSTRAVTPERWEVLRAELRASHARVRARLANPETWPAGTHPGDVMTFTVHTAYHLGAIRQILHVNAPCA